jgi:hypothetical protein
MPDPRGSRTTMTRFRKVGSPALRRNAGVRPVTRVRPTAQVRPAVRVSRLRPDLYAITSHPVTGVPASCILDLAAGKAYTLNADVHQVAPFRLVHGGRRTVIRQVFPRTGPPSFAAASGIGYRVGQPYGASPSYRNWSTVANRRLKVTGTKRSSVKRAAVNRAAVKRARVKRVNTKRIRTTARSRRTAHGRPPRPSRGPRATRRAMVMA